MDDVLTDKTINQLQQFILRNREAVQDPDSERPLTFHGLRHTYAAEKYRQLIADGVSELDADFLLTSGTMRQAIQCYTTLCNGFTPFVLLAYYFTK